MNRIGYSLAMLAVVALAGVALGQRSRTSDATINTVPLELRSAAPYQLRCELQPKQEIIIRAPLTGFVREVSVKLGDNVRSRAPLVRLDAELQQNSADRAAAQVQAARAEVDILKSQSAGAAQITRAEAAVRIAEADKRQADYWLKQTGILSPMDGQVVEVHAQEGQYVTQGQTLLRISNYETLVVWMPWDANDARRGSKEQLTIENGNHTGTITAVVPIIDAHRRLLPLRGRLVTAVLELPNPNSDLRPGQTVNCPLVPWGAVADVLEKYVKKGTVQVLRGNVVLDIAVETHAIPYRTYVTLSGSFKEGDELITSTSRPVRGGARVDASKVRRSL